MQSLHDVAALVLAAGKGTRMRTSLPKVLVPLADRPLVLHLLDAIGATGVARRILVVGHGADQVRETLGPRWEYVLQAEQLGMAHAVSMARDLLDRPEGPGHLVVTVGDSPLLRPATLRSLLDLHLRSGAACSFLTAVYPDPPPPYARVIRDAGGRVVRCVEVHGATAEERAVRELLTSHFVFRSRDLWDHLDTIRPHPVTGERYLTDIVAPLVAAGRRVEALPVVDAGELAGLNTPEEVAWAATVLERRRG